MILLFVLGGTILLGSAKDSGDLQASAEGLVEQHPRLELRDEWEPSQERDGCEQEQSHRYLVPSSKVPDRSPETSFLDQRLACLCNLHTHEPERDDGGDEMIPRQNIARKMYNSMDMSLLSIIFYCYFQLLCSSWNIVLFMQI